MIEYKHALKHVLDFGNYRQNRTGIDSLSVFGLGMEFDMQDRFPIVTTKKVHFKSVVHELLWFLRGDTNIKYLKDNGVSIWDKWADKNGEVGPMYGKQWRSFGISHNSLQLLKQTDQIRNVIESIRTDPYSRRHIVTAGNPEDLPYCALAPCHVMFQFYVNDQKLSCQVYQRSADMFLGVPFNISSYALLTHMIAQQCELDVDRLIWVGGDCRVYSNHIAQVEEQLERKCKTRPMLSLNSRDSIDDYKHFDVELINYNHYPEIKGQVAV